MIYKIIYDHSSNIYSNEKIKIYHTENINVTDFNDSNSIKIKDQILKYFEVYNQIHSMQDRSALGKISHNSFFKNEGKARKKYKSEFFKAYYFSQYRYKSPILKIKKNKVHIKFNAFFLKIDKDFFEVWNFKYFDAILGIKMFDQNRIEII